MVKLKPFVNCPPFKLELRLKLLSMMQRFETGGYSKTLFRLCVPCQSNHKQKSKPN